MYVGIFSVLVRQYASYGHVLVYIGILFRFSTLVRLVNHVLCTSVFCLVLVRYISTLGTAMFYICWYFFRSWYVSTLSTAMFSCMLVFYSVLVRQYAQYGHVLCMLVFYSVLVRQYAQYGHVLCMLVFFSVLVRLVRPCSMHVGILFGLRTLSTAMFSCMLVFYSVLVRQYAQYGRVLCISVFYSVLVRQYAQYSHVLMYVGILFSLSTLVRLVRPCSMYVGIFFGLSTLSTAMFYACWFFIRSQYAQYGHVLCMLVFHSVLVRLVANCSIFIGMHAWLSSALPQSTACNKDS